MAAPPNDNFASATDLVGVSGTDNQFTSGHYEIGLASSETGEPAGTNFTSTPGYRSVWYRITLAVRSVLTVQNVFGGQVNPVTTATEPSWTSGSGFLSLVDTAGNFWQSGNATVAWAPSTAVAIGKFVVVGSKVFVSGNAGTTGGSAPAWSGAVNHFDAVTDNSITWHYYGIYLGPWTASTEIVGDFSSTEFSFKKLFSQTTGDTTRLWETYNQPFSAPGIAVYTGASVGALTEVASVASAPLTATLEAGTYYVQIASYAAEVSGNLYMEWAATPVPVVVVSDQWRFLLLDRATFEAVMCLDRLAYERTATMLLGQPWQAAGKAPADDPRINTQDGNGDPFLEEGIRFLVGLRREDRTPRWQPRLATILLNVSDDADDDLPVTSFVGYDSWQLLMSRPVVNADGSLIGKNGMSFNSTRGDVIVTTLLANTVDNHGSVYIDASSGTIDATPTLDINFPQGTTVGEAWQTLVAAGVLDIVLTPVYDPLHRPGILAELNVYTQAGDQSDDAVFAWDKGPRSISKISRLTDGGQRANVIQFYDGQGGNPVTRQTDSASVTRYGQYWRQQFLTARPGSAAAVALATFDLLLSKNGQTTVTFTPTQDHAPRVLDAYTIGDRVPVHASKRLRRPLAGLMRVYGIQLALDDNEIVTSLTLSADES